MKLTYKSMNPAVFRALAVGLLLVAGGGARADVARMDDPATGPYRDGPPPPDGLAILSPPPAPGSARDRADKAAFLATRRLAGTPRWRLATDDVDSDAFTHFACALDLQLDSRTAPALAHLLDRAGTAAVVDPVKRHYHRARPYLRWRGPICQPRTTHLAQNGDYPSGHAAGGWMESAILAELVPDRATQLLARGRAFGESRMICGAHSRSAVEAGWQAGAAALAALHGSPAFRADMEAARRELVVLRRSAPRADPARCAAERAALSQSIPGDP